MTESASRQPSAPTTVSARALIGRPVRWRGVRLGSVVDVLLDSRLCRTVGLEVECAGGQHRFLPAAACELNGDLSASTPLALIEPGSLDYYRSRGVGLATSRVVVAGGVEIGQLVDVLFDATGGVRDVVVVSRNGERRRLRPRILELRADPEGR